MPNLSIAQRLTTETTVSFDFVSTIVRSIVLCLLLIPGIGIGDETVIHRCVQADGTVAFQETPCAEASDQDEKVEEESPPSIDDASGDAFFDFVNPFDAEEDASALAEQQPAAPPSQDRAECEKETRDAIDAIDARLQDSDSRENDRKHLAELLALTRQLRACKQL